MESNNPSSGWIFLGIGVFLTSSSTFLGHIASFGAANEFVGGFLAGLSVVGFGAAIFLLVRSGSATTGK